MSEYGRDESAPTPYGVFVACFIGGSGIFADCSLCVSLGECWVFTECFVVISWVFVALLTIRS
ncbi:MAG: hypothetical protein HXN91_09530, partial [Prevotella pallens]